MVLPCSKSYLQYWMNLPYFPVHAKVLFNDDPERQFNSKWAPLPPVANKKSVSKFELESKMFRSCNWKLDI